MKEFTDKANFRFFLEVYIRSTILLLGVSEGKTIAIEPSKTDFVILQYFKNAAIYLIIISKKCYPMQSY